MDIVEKYIAIAVKRTELPIYLELDPFFSYINEKYSIKIVNYKGQLKDRTILDISCRYTNRVRRDEEIIK